MKRTSRVGLVRRSEGRNPEPEYLTRGERWMAYAAILLFVVALAIVGRFEAGL